MQILDALQLRLDLFCSYLWDATNMQSVIWATKIRLTHTER